ncbi:hypothetical protein S7711_03572 [Stachybotrys chartarum IBT 7711]|uniref:Gamma interferon inducible lysosomal thiol reductase n=1 Tax=Stachybotrys chartarum (strain CBS 109288 / IBT 7711) TaxID=1280523 RepID=A0A084B1S7_STACB|nr:hypothetical protein S7711_03572 [Stachybotrys chartarum IBT 7711]
MLEKSPPPHPPPHHPPSPLRRHLHPPAAPSSSAMDEKTSSNMTQVRRARPIVLVLLLLVFIYTLWQWPSTHPGITTGHGGAVVSETSDTREPVGSSSGKKLVPLEAHIISKCPDTRDALRQLILPVMQQVLDKVDFQLSYIGKLTEDDGVECKHGPTECLGNIIELCARDLYPDPKINLGFIMCLTKDYRQIPDRALVEDCALEHAIDFDALNECAARDNGAHGMDMLRKSVQRSAEVRPSMPAPLAEFHRAR